MWISGVFCLFLGVDSDNKRDIIRERDNPRFIGGTILAWGTHFSVRGVAKEPHIETTALLRAADSSRNTGVVGAPDPARLVIQEQQTRRVLVTHSGLDASRLRLGFIGRFGDQSLSGTHSVP